MENSLSYQELTGIPDDTDDANAALLGSGSAWYAAEAFRAVNQAVGVLFCHLSVLVMADEFKNGLARSLSKAVLPGMTNQ